MSEQRLESILKNEARLLRPVSRHPTGPRKTWKKKSHRVKVLTAEQTELIELLDRISDCNIAWLGRVIRHKPAKWGGGSTSEEGVRSRNFNESENTRAWKLLVERLIELQKRMEAM